MLEPSCTKEHLYFQKCQQHLLWETLEERLIRKLLQIYWGNNEELSQRSDKEFSGRTGIRNIYAVKSTRIGLGWMIQGKPDGCVNQDSQGCSLGSGMVQYFIHQDRTTGARADLDRQRMIKSIWNMLNLRSLWQIVWEYLAIQETGTEKNPIQETEREQQVWEPLMAYIPISISSIPWWFRW